MCVSAPRAGAVGGAASEGGTPARLWAGSCRGRGAQVANGGGAGRPRVEPGARASRSGGCFFLEPQM